MYGCITLFLIVFNFCLYITSCVTLPIIIYHLYLISTFLPNVFKGASNDIMQATRLAKAMVTQYGLSEKVGIIFIDDKGIYSIECA